MRVCKNVPNGTSHQLLLHLTGTCGKCLLCFIFLANRFFQTLWAFWGSRAEDSKCPPKEEKRGAGGGSQVLLTYIISWECKFVYTTEI